MKRRAHTCDIPRPWFFRPRRYSVGRQRAVVMQILLLVVAAVGWSACHTVGNRPDALEFYRVRMEYTTTSDWSVLEVQDTLSVLTVRTLGLIGSPTTAKTTMREVVLAQGLQDAEAGQKVGIILEYAIRAPVKSGRLTFLLKKGAVNGSALRFWCIETGQRERLLYEFEHNGVIPGQPGDNPKSCNLDLTLLQGARPEQRVTQPPRVSRMALAFYYPWYHLESWKDSRLTDSPTRPYSSDDPGVISRHIHQAKRAGIDGFVCSWWGPGDFTDKNFNKILDIARDSGFSAALYFETLSASGPRDEREIERWLRYAISTYRAHSAMITRNGKPLIVLWASNALPRTRWKAIMDRLKADGLEATYLGMGDDIADLQVFDGLHQYGVFSIPSLSEYNRLGTRATRDYAALGGPLTEKISTATVQPGYDERTIPGRPGLFRSREEGRFYSSTFQAAIDADPDWIFIVSWNEWYEQTQIEPSATYGDRYLVLTEEFLKKWKNQSPR
jgi:hypothetical protein